MNSLWQMALVGGFIALVLIDAGVAQIPDAKPKEFYDPGYVTRTDPKSKDHSLPAIPEGSAPSTQSAQTPAPSNLKLQTSPGPTSALTSLPQYKTYKVKALSAVLNSMDKKHFESALQELIAVAQNFDFAIHDVYVPGNVENIGQTSPLFLPLIARGATISFSNIPRRYQATLSPTWVIETAQGEIIMEATGPLAENFDEQGDFVDLPRKITEITPVSTPTPEGAQDKIESMQKGAEVVAASPTVLPTAPAKSVKPEDGVQPF